MIFNLQKIIQKKKRRENNNKENAIKILPINTNNENIEIKEKIIPLYIEENKNENDEIKSNKDSEKVQYKFTIEKDIKKDIYVTCSSENLSKWDTNNENQLIPYYDNGKYYYQANNRNN